MRATLVTSNKHKLLEWQRLMPEGISLDNQSIDLDEIQSLDYEEIARYKVRQAYEVAQAPVIVEDVSAEITEWNGLPGPFVKFFNERLGNDALYKLAGEGAHMKAICTAAYYDGTKEILVKGVTEGRITAPRGEDFGFDCIFVPDGETQTYAEMGYERKDKLSHRRRAIDLLTSELQKLQDS